MSTVRSAAAARNRGGPSRGWLILAIVLALLALSLRVAWAAPDDLPDRIDVDPLDPDELDDLADRIDLADDAPLDAIDPDDLDELLGETTEEPGASDPDPLEIVPAMIAAGSEDSREAALRRSRSKIGRVDVSLIWRHTDPMIRPVRDEVWLLGTWRP